MSINRLKSVTRGMRSCVPLLVLLALVCLPVTTRADTFTLDGAPVDSFSFNTTLKTFSVQMATADALPYKTDDMMGTEIITLFFDEFAIVDVTLTLENEFEFGRDFVKSFQYQTGSDMLISNVTFTYEAVKITEGSGGSGGDGGSGGGGGTSMPESSSVALLASGLIGLISFSHRKLATN